MCVCRGTRYRPGSCHWPSANTRGVLAALRSWTGRRNAKRFRIEHFRALDCPQAVVSATISSMKAETIRQEALSLPVQERAELAEQLLSSLDALSEVEIEQLWLQEAARRAEEMDRGLTKRVAADEVRLQAQALLK